MVSGDPSVIEMDDLTFEGNSASAAGNTLYVVWRSITSMNSTQFSSFVTSSEDMNKEAKVETWKGGIMTLSEVVRGGGGSEGSGSEKKEGYKVCTQIETSDTVGKIVVVVMDGEEEIGEDDGCVVEMEGGEVEGAVEMGEVNGEEVVLDMGKRLKEVLEECEDLQIVMNVSFVA